MRKLTALLLSLLLHGGIAWWGWRALPSGGGARQERVTEITTLPPRARPKKNAGGSHRPITAKDLALGSGSGPSVGFFRTPDLGSQELDGERAQSPEVTLARTDVYQRVYELIDQSLEYPPEFVEAKIEGFVNATIVFGPDGRYSPGLSEVKSSSLFLKVLVRRVFRRAFGAEPLASLARLKISFRVGATFEFTHTYHPELTAIRMPGFPAAPAQVESGERHEPGRALGNRLSFVRVANRVPTAKVVTFLTADGQRGYSPGFDILPWLEKAVKHVDDWAHDRAKIDPLDKYRNDPDW